MTTKTKETPQTTAENMANNKVEIAATPATQVSNPADDGLGKKPMSRQDWRSEMQAMGDAEGFYEDIGDEHTALFVRRGKTLIVTFENLDHVYENSETRMPWGFNFVEDRGWSFLGMMAHSWTWYRDETVYDFFDRLRDQGFFEGFEKVVFYGASMGAYAACTFSSAAPNSTVIAISPQATLNREIASWETRYKKAWRRDYNTRYGFAPDMVETAENVYLFYDPTETLDAMHACLFQSANVSKFKCRYLGHRIASFWISLGLLKPIIQDCVDGVLTQEKFYKTMRARRESMRYRRELLGRVQARGRHDLVVLLCEYVLARSRGPKFRQALKVSRSHLKS